VTTIRVPHGDNHDLWIAPDNPQRMINANDGGANVSFNGGRAGPSRTIRRRSSTTSSPPRTCRTTSAARSRTTARRACRAPARVDLYPVGGGESGYIAPDPRTDVFYAGSYGGLLTRIDRRTGQRAHQRLARQPDGPLGEATSRALPVDVPDRLLADRPERALRGVAARLATTNEGQSWQRISPT
jgi:hypothetical protein